MRSLRPTEILDSVLYFAIMDGELEIFENDRVRIHSIFSILREEYPDILKDFIFQEGVFFPRSRTLDECLFALQPDSLTLAKSFSEYQLNKDGIIKRWNLVISKKIMNDRKMIKDLRDISKKFVSGVKR